MKDAARMYAVGPKIKKVAIVAEHDGIPLNTGGAFYSGPLLQGASVYSDTPQMSAVYVTTI